MPHVVGVYGVVHRASGKIYVGSSSTSLIRRLRAHRNSLKAGKHINRHLQNAWRLYGEAAFSFRVLESCEPGDCVQKEQYWIDYYRSYDRENGYNLSPTAGSTRGYKHSEATKAKLAALHKGVPKSPEAIARMVRSKTGQKNSAESRRKQSESSRGRPRSEAHKAKLRENCRKLAEGNRGRPLSAEHRANLSAAVKRAYAAGAVNPMKGRPLSQHQRDALRTANTGRKPSPETRAKMSAAAKVHGHKGGKAWAAKLSREQHAELGRKRAAVRWGKKSEDANEE